MSIGRVPGATGIQPSIVDAKGDLIVATAADSVSRLAVGANATVLTADSAEATGVKWAALPASGKVLQVIQGTYSTSTVSNSSTYADTGLTATITPSSTASKVLVLYTLPSEKSSGHAQNSISYRLLRAGTSVQETNDQMYQNTTMQNLFTFHYSYLDSPSTTSSTIYKVQFRNFSNNAAVAICSNNNLAAIILMEIGA